MLQSTCGSRLAVETYARGFILHEARIQNLNRYGAINQHVSGAINSTHPANTQALLDLVFVVENLADKGVCNAVTMKRGISLQRRFVFRTNLHTSWVMPSACGAMEH
jgi:predicted AlkP superfamily phosphohydrolase/phosphomutase